MINIIKAGEHHIPDICNLWLEFMRYTADIDPHFTMREKTSAGFEKEYLRPAMESEKSLVLIAYDGEKAVGYARAEVQDVPNNRLRQIGHLDHLFITETYRRRGIGEQVYAEILGWFQSKGIERVQLDVIIHNAAATSFWRKHGYKDFQKTLYKQI